MTVAELLAALQTLDPGQDVRVGDQLEAGPYEHSSVGGAWRVACGIVLCANPDAELVEEDPGIELPCLWRPRTQ